MSSDASQSTSAPAPAPTPQSGGGQAVSTPVYNVRAPAFVPRSQQMSSSTAPPSTPLAYGVTSGPHLFVPVRAMGMPAGQYGRVMPMGVANGGMMPHGVPMGVGMGLGMAGMPGMVMGGVANPTAAMTPVQGQWGHPAQAPMRPQSASTGGSYMGAFPRGGHQQQYSRGGFHQHQQGFYQGGGRGGFGGGGGSFHQGGYGGSQFGSGYGGGGFGVRVFSLISISTFESAQLDMHSLKNATHRMPIDRHMCNVD